MTGLRNTGTRWPGAGAKFASDKGIGQPRPTGHESGGFGRAEIRRVEALVRDNADKLRQAWDEYFTE